MAEEHELYDSIFVLYLTIILRGRAGYEVLDNQRGALVIYTILCPASRSRIIARYNTNVLSYNSFLNDDGDPGNQVGNEFGRQRREISHMRSINTRDGYFDE